MRCYCVPGCPGSVGESSSSGSCGIPSQVPSSTGATIRNDHNSHDEPQQAQLGRWHWGPLNQDRRKPTSVVTRPLINTAMRTTHLVDQSQNNLGITSTCLTYVEHRSTFSNTLGTSNRNNFKGRGRINPLIPTRPLALLCPARTLEKDIVATDHSRRTFVCLNGGMPSGTHQADFPA